MSRAARAVGLACALLLGIGLLSATALGLAADSRKPKAVRLTVTQAVPVVGLHPGRATSFPVVVRNRSKKRVRVQRVEARLRRSVPGCPTSALRLGKVTVKKVLKPRKRLTVRLPIALDRSAPDGCQGRSIALTLKAIGKPVR